MAAYRESLRSKETAWRGGRGSAALVLCCYILSCGGCLCEWQLLLLRVLGSRYLYWKGLQHCEVSTSHGQPSLLWCHHLIMGVLSSEGFSLRTDGPPSLHLVLSVCMEQQPGYSNPSDSSISQFLYFSCWSSHMWHVVACSSSSPHPHPLPVLLERGLRIVVYLCVLAYF